MTLPGVALLNGRCGKLLITNVRKLTQTEILDRGEEQGVISSSLDFDQLALLTLGFVKEVASNNESSMLSNLKSQSLKKKTMSRLERI